MSNFFHSKSSLSFAVCIFTCIASVSAFAEPQTKETPTAQEQLNTITESPEYKNQMETVVMDRNGFMQQMQKSFNAKYYDNDGGISNEDANAQNVSGNHMLSVGLSAETVKNYWKNNDERKPISAEDQSNFRAEMEKQFSSMDKNGDGKVTAAEVNSSYGNSQVHKSYPGYKPNSPNNVANTQSSYTPPNVGIAPLGGR